MRMKTPYWFDKNLYSILENAELSNRHSLEMKIGDVRKYRANGELLYKTSLIQDGMTRYIILVQNKLQIISWTDFEHVCREYKYIGMNLTVQSNFATRQQKFWYVPSVIKAE